MEEMISLLLDFNHFSVAFRLTFSLIFGAVIGIDRYRKGSSAGPKTHSLVCLGSALVMITSLYASQDHGVTDIMRLPAQVISGIGFLCAGTILVTGKNQIKGLTTSAGLWLSGCLGIAIGIGYYFAAFLAIVLVMIMYYVFGKFDSFLRQSNVMDIYLEYHHPISLGNIIQQLKNSDCVIVSIDQSKNFIHETAPHSHQVLISIECHKMKQQKESIVNQLQQMSGIIMAEAL